jgi:hypothetical protein
MPPAIRVKHNLIYPFPISEMMTFALSCTLLFSYLCSSPILHLLSMSQTTSHHKCGCDGNFLFPWLLSVSSFMKWVELGVEGEDLVWASGSSGSDSLWFCKLRPLGLAEDRRGLVTIKGGPNGCCPAHHTLGPTEISTVMLQARCCLGYCLWAKKRNNNPYIKLSREKIMQAHANYSEKYMQIVSWVFLSSLNGKSTALKPATLNMNPIWTLWNTQQVMSHSDLVSLSLKWSQ